MRPREVFLSHSSADKQVAKRVLKGLKSAGIPTWYAPYNLVGSQKWHDEIGEALRRCDWFVLLLSPSSVESMWVKNELLYALNTRRLYGRILPVLIENCDWERFSWTLEAIQRVDMAADFRVGMIDLLRVWGLSYGKPPRKRKKPGR